MSGTRLYMAVLASALAHVAVGLGLMALSAPHLQAPEGALPRVARVAAPVKVKLLGPGPTRAAEAVQSPGPSTASTPGVASERPKPMGSALVAPESFKAGPLPTEEGTVEPALSQSGAEVGRGASGAPAEIPDAGAEVGGRGPDGPGAGAPGAGVPAAGVPGAGVLGAGALGAGAPGVGVPGAGVPGAGVLGAGAPGAGAPGAGAPGAGAPGAGAPGGGVGAARGPGGDPAVLHRRLAESARRCYPQAARKFHLEGEVGLSFCLAGEGVLSSLALEGSTGSPLLDRAARDCVVQGALPLPMAAGCYAVPVRFGRAD